MKRRSYAKLYVSIGMLVAFIVWTVLLRFVDVQPIGPQGSTVGFATLNGYIHGITGVHMTMYTVTDWLGFVPIGTAAGFAALGFCQWIKRKKLLAVDRNILTLGIFYIVVMAVYVFFEVVNINYRPVLIEGILEASYPSSTTMLVMCVMPTATMQLNRRIKKHGLRCIIICAIIVFTVFMITGRIVSGVHWITDIVGGTLISSGLVLAYSFFSENRG